MSIRKIGAQDLELFHQRLGALIESRAPLPEGIRTFAAKIEDKDFREAALRLAAGLAEGESLSEATAKNPATFPGEYTAIIRAGEEGMGLGRALEVALEQERFERGLSEQLRASLFYPVLVFIVVSAAYAASVVLAYPVFMEGFRATSAPMPLAARLVQAIYHYGLYLSPLAVLAAVGLFLWSRGEGGRSAIDAIKLRVPLLQDVIVSRFLALFSNSLSSLIQAGTPLPASLGLISQATGNRAIRGKIAAAAAGAGSGHSLKTVISSMDLFPELYVAGASAGEDAGVLADSLTGLAEIHREEAEAKSRALLEIVDLGLIIALGLWVGLILVALFSMYFKLITLIDPGTLW